MKVFTLVGIVLMLFYGTSSCNNNDGQAENKATVSAAIAKGEPFIIEVVGSPGTEVDTAQLIDLCVQSGISQPQMYYWKDRYVIYDTASNAGLLVSRIRSAFPNALVNIYEDPFYEFNRKHCLDTSVANEWDHIILTANLVEDTVLQKEYMTYHATQFEKWPEVSNGFCNANFQQLLLFRNGRQLMLVISIPKGTNLNELNPKTTENNPRVDEWNNLMKKYQEGIEGTRQGEVWVVLEETGNRQ